jgi:hypothetical protein
MNNMSDPYKRWQKNLDSVSYALIATTLLAWGLRSGAFFFAPALFFAADAYPTLAFLLLFAANLALIFVFTLLDRRAPGMKAMWAIATSIAIALVIDIYLRLLFATHGSVILGSGRGIVGDLSNFWIDWTVWFAAVWLARAALFFKEKLHRHFDTSIAIFIVAVLAVLSFAIF